MILSGRVSEFACSSCQYTVASPPSPNEYVNVAGSISFRSAL
jgi:hypothetical protein